MDTFSALKLRLLALSTIWLGFSLRVFQLGHDGLWNDEAGQAIAALQPTLGGMLRIEQAHVFAMPLDYHISRVVSHIGLQETVMRFPAVVWGTLALALCFALARMLAGPVVAWLAMLLLGLSAPHVLYSQEMRPYSALVCFSMLANSCLLRAIEANRWRDWATFVVATAIGSYFHPFVLLVMITGVCHLSLDRLAGRPVAGRSRHVLASFTLLLLLFFPGYLLFGPTQSLRRPLLQWSQSLPDAIAQGLGMRTLPFSASTPAVSLWEVASVSFAGIGIVVLCTRWRRYVRLSGVVLGGVLQIGFILAGDAVKQYWFLPRQLIHLAPILLILTALGITRTASYAAAHLPEGPQHARRRQSSFGLALATAAGVFGLAAMPRLADYYRYPKSTGRTIVAKILETHRSGEPILVIPDYEEEVYRFYLMQEVSPVEVSRSLKPATWDNLATSISDSATKIYLITPSMMTPEQTGILDALDFTLLDGPPSGWFGTQSLFVRAGRG